MRVLAAYLFNDSDSSFTPVFDGLLLGRLEGQLRFAEDPLVSRSHCQLRVIHNEVFVEDLASSNQTRVNRIPIIPRTPRKLQFNDVIRIGNQRLILTPSNARVPAGRVERTQEIKVCREIEGQLSN